MKVKIVKLKSRKKSVTTEDITSNSTFYKITATVVRINVMPNAPNAIDSKVTIFDEIT
jgi:hypothetical protein